MVAPILFLDIDGVLNSNRTAYAFGGFPSPSNIANTTHRFDWVAVAMIHQLVAKGVEIVLSSTWRLQPPDRLAALTTALGFPLLDVTPYYPDAIRGVEIQQWLDAHPQYTVWAIVDDDADMLPSQQGRLVQTSTSDGLRMHEYLALTRLLGVDPIPERTLF